MKNALWILLLASTQAISATIAVIDSGVDVEHKDFANSLWKNTLEIADNGRDDDRNGYQDDVFGWNFAEQNNLVIDRSYLGTFSADPYMFFQIQGRMFMGTVTEADKKWLESKRNDPNFGKEMGKFGNFVHGTHVAGITVKNNPEAKILSVKLIPTEIKPFMDSLASQNLQAKNSGFRMKMLKTTLKALAGEQMKLLEEIASYVGNHKADIANGSFGTGFDQAKMITDNAFKLIFFRAPTQEESDEVAAYFMAETLEAGKSMVASAPNTLFVFAAGNSAMDNDKYPTSPTNIVADNVISVAATYNYEYLAPFSNYGAKTVDVAAPGMLINSQIPGDEYLEVSGTSQAAPYVANIAAQIKDTNKALTPKEIKQIIIGTVDKKNFLKGVVESAGVTNMERALYAAKLSLATSVNNAISESNISIADVESFSTNKMSKSKARHIIPMALPSQYK